ncbi:DNA repair protein [Lachnellula occidentalis]|uniref:DNA repair protein n=1 Tax=Lachnellula occidentalis TaxID=215460 RepID=A0A8H8RIC2_9HELO|nr:DNA repair protein [Lachnellula occidentalis]
MTPPTSKKKLDDITARLCQLRMGIKPGYGLAGNEEEEEVLDQERLKAEADAKHRDEAKSNANDSDSEAMDTDDDTSKSTASYEHSVEPAKQPRDMEGEDPDDANEFAGYKREVYHESHVVKGDHVFPIYEYLGPRWLKSIPPGIVVTPHDYQLKAAAQAIFCLKEYGLFILGDATGLGKTLSATLALYELKHKPGLSLVLCPASLCHHWLRSINGIWESGSRGLKAFMLNDQKVSASDLLAQGWDVIICSYEYFETSSRKMTTYNTALSEWVKNRTGVKPTRPTCALQSTLWRELKIPFKTIIMDEAHKVMKPSGRRHQAIKEHLYTNGFILLTATIPHNKWHEIYGYLDFKDFHPFHTMNMFLHAFASKGYTNKIERPTVHKIRLLQRFMQAFIIVRPNNILTLPACTIRKVSFLLRAPCAFDVGLLTTKYEQGSHASGDQANEDPESGGAFGLAVRAMMAALHPLCRSEDDTKKIDKKKKKQRGGYESYNDDDDDSEYEPSKKNQGKKSPSEDNTTDGEHIEDRVIFLKKVRDFKDLVEVSGRLEKFMELFMWIKSVYPSEKVLIFSFSLKFLDVIAEAIRRAHNVEPLRYDGTIQPADRAEVEASFKTVDSIIPLLMTMGAGSVGLNVQSASVVIITEPQWNWSNVVQAIGRAWRHGQTKPVKVFILEGANSEIDGVTISCQKKKAMINEELMRVLIRRHDQEPLIMDLMENKPLSPMIFSEFESGGKKAGVEEQSDDDMNGLEETDMVRQDDVDDDMAETEDIEELKGDTSSSDDGDENMGGTESVDEEDLWE